MRKRICDNPRRLRFKNQNADYGDERGEGTIRQGSLEINSGIGPNRVDALVGLGQACNLSLERGSYRQHARPLEGI